MNPSRQQSLIVAALLCGIGVVHLASLREGHIWGDDFAHYLLHARNLAEGVPYAQIGYIYNPHYPSLAPPTYPPGCPALLAPVYAIWGLNLTALKVEMIVFFLVFLLAVYLGFRKELGFARTLALVAILGLNHYFIKDVNGVASDMPFLALVYLALWLIRKADEVPLNTWRRSVYFMVSGVVIYLAYSTRSLGALLIPAMLVHQDPVGKWRATWPAIWATAVFGILAVLQAMLFHSDRHYLDQLGAGPVVLLHNAFGYLIRLATFWHNGYWQAPSMALFAGVTLLAGLGYADCLRRRITICEAFTAIYVITILLWPSYQGERYLYPVIPLYVFYALRGLDHRWIANRPRLRQAVVAFLVLAVSLTYAARVVHHKRGPMPEGVAKRQSVEMFEHIRSTTGDHDVIVFIKPRALALFTRRKASVYHRADKDQALWDYFRQIGATRLVVVENDQAFTEAEDPAMLRFLRGFVERNRARLRPTFANSDFTVYRFN
jgi:hypothetical protein